MGLNSKQVVTLGLMVTAGVILFLLAWILSDQYGAALSTKPILLISVIFIFFIFLFLYFFSVIYSQIREARKDIYSAVVPKFLNPSVQTNDLIELSIEVWRMQSRLSKILATADANQKDIVNGSIKKILRYLDKNDVEIVDHTGQKFNDGRNLDILSVESDPKAAHPTIKETVEPTILFKGQVVRKGKVIVLAKKASDVESVKE